MLCLHDACVIFKKISDYTIFISKFEIDECFIFMKGF